MRLSDKLQSLANQAKSISEQMTIINKERNNYDGCILLYRQKGSKNVPNVGLICSVDFVHGSITVRTAYSDKSSSMYLNQIDFEVIDKAEFANRLK